MRWLTPRMRSEDGATAIMVALLMVPLIGFLAISIDVGVLYAERAQLQNGADGAALAVAQDCADGACTANPNLLSATLTDANANDGAANALSVSMGANEVTVTAGTREAGTGSPYVQHPFATALSMLIDGTDTSTTVHADATAVWGPPGSGPAILPLTLSYCEFQKSLIGTPPVYMTIRYDENKTCKKDPTTEDINGGFGWLDQIAGTCEVQVDVGASLVGSNPGNDPPNSCDEVLRDLEGKTVFIPIFDDSSGTGGHGLYHIWAFASFTVTGWKFGGPSLYDNVDPNAPKCVGNDGKKCSGNARFIQGYFEEWVSVADAFELGGPATNATIYKLTN